MPKVLTSLLQGILFFSIDSSFFPQCSYLILAHIIIISNNEKIGKANFICTIALPYRDSYALELCSTLAIMKIVKYLILESNDRENQFAISINTDCTLVIFFLFSTLKIISNIISLYQVKREILLLKQRHDIIIKPYKVDAHQDDIKSWNRLSFQEKLNTICNERAKRFILSKNRDTVPFPFILHSLYISTDLQVFLNKEEIYYYISIKHITPYF